MKIAKKVLFTSVLFSLSFCFWSQDSKNDVEEISLPDVSTVISGGAPKVGKSAVPEYSKVLPASNPNEDLIPVLPDASSAHTSSQDISISSDVVQKDIYAEGDAGVGYPGFVTGKFSIYRQSGESPFRVNFGTETQNGYAGNSLTSGYFDRNTFINAQKTFTREKVKLNLSGDYENIDNGLQDKVANISDINQDFLGANIDFSADVSDMFNVELGLDGDWYKRYATITGGISVDDYAKDVSVISLNPTLALNWNVKSFYFGFDAGYLMEHDVKDSFYEEQTVNRGQFGVNAHWSNSLANIYADAAAVVGNEIGDNSVIVPFTVGADFGIKTSLSSRSILLSANGGIDSNLAKVSELEKKFKFASLHVLSGEVSDWFGKFSVTVPYKDFFTFDFDSEFRTTAYDNGSIQPDYDSSSNFGQYLFVQDDMTQFNTNVNLGFRYGFANFGFNWKSYWADTPVTEDKSVISLSFSIQDKEAKVGFDSLVGIAVDSDADNTPILDMSVFWRVSNAVRLAVSANDVVKLIMTSERDYAGDYIERSGNVAALVKFFF